MVAQSFRASQQPLAHSAPTTPPTTPLLPPPDYMADPASMATAPTAPTAVPAGDGSSEKKVIQFSVPNSKVHGNNEHCWSRTLEWGSATAGSPCWVVVLRVAGGGLAARRCGGGIGGGGGRSIANLRRTRQEELRPAECLHHIPTRPPVFPEIPFRSASSSAAAAPRSRAFVTRPVRR